MVAFIHLALGMIVGTLVRSEMNGLLLVTHPCVLHVFLGAALGLGSSMVARFIDGDPEPRSRAISARALICCWAWTGSCCSVRQQSQCLATTAPLD